MWPAEPQRHAAFFLALSAALVAATCSRESHLEPAAPLRPLSAPSARSSVAAVSSVRAGNEVRSIETPPAAQAGALPDGISLPRFQAALGELDAKTRRDHVRVIWLGDSHTAADYMTGAFRRRLGLRFGVGGPGLVRLGIGSYRHTGVKLVREGRFRVEPTPPSSRSTEGDTAFGFEGMRSIPADDRARVEARIDARFVSDPVRYELLFDLPAGAGFRVTLGKRTELVNAKTALERVSGSPIARLRFEAPAGDGLELDLIRGLPRFYGMIAEGTVPGVVLDTSGIDGARFATALAWNADVLAAELGARHPELVVLAYGTNEAFDNRRAEACGSDASELMTRVRRGAPDADCLILAPPDAAAPDFSSLPRVAEIEEVLRRAAARLGCGFFSLRASMGGNAGFVRWLKETPPLARGDRIHLTPAGYERLGEGLADTLIGSYERNRKK